MAVPLCMKRMAKERLNLEKPNSDYFVYIDDDNLRSFHAYVIGPKDTLYEHKFVKVKFNIPDQYPLIPPSCKFIQSRGGRIHPNLYVEGKVCLSILGTWDGEPWALAMSIETVLITIRSLLDNEPYKHEPHQSNNVAFNKYVQYGTWTWLFLDYLKNEENEAARSFLESHIAQHGDKIVADLKEQQIAESHTSIFKSPYERRTSSGLIPNYPKLIQEVTEAVEQCRTAYYQKRQNQSSEPQMNQECALVNHGYTEPQQQRQSQAHAQLQPQLPTTQKVEPMSIVSLLDDDDNTRDGDKGGNPKVSSAKRIKPVNERAPSRGNHQPEISVEVIDLT